jgi:thymidine phosphorylase
MRIKNVHIDSQSEHVLYVHEEALRVGDYGFQPLDRVLVVGSHPDSGERREISAVVHFCRDSLVAPDELGLSELAFRDLGLPEGADVRATLAPSPASVDRVRDKLGGARLARSDFDAILRDVVAHRYSKIELSMFVLACALRRLDSRELVDLTRAMIATGASLDFGPGPIVDKHCIGGIPGNRTTPIVVPILAARGLVVPKTSSRAITSPAGTADTMGVLADVALDPRRLREVVAKTGACIAWGGALGLAPADDILITVERPMGVDTESQMVASILAKKKTAGATHTLLDLPVGETAKVRSAHAAEFLAEMFRGVAAAIDLELDVVFTEAHAPIGRGIGPRLEALDVLAVLACEPEAPADLREKSLLLAARLLESVGAAAAGDGYRLAREALDSGAAARKFDEIREAQGPRALLAAARLRREIASPAAGRVLAIDCYGMAKVAKLAGAPAQPAAGVRLLRGLGAEVVRGEPLLEIHAQSTAQLEFAAEYLAAHPEIYVLDGAAKPAR